MTLDEQIAGVVAERKGVADIIHSSEREHELAMLDAILASLRELAAIKTAEMPKTPNIDAMMIGCVSGKTDEWPQLRLEVCALRIFALRMKAENDELMGACHALRNNFGAKNPFRKNSQQWVDWNDSIAEQLSIIDAAIDKERTK